MNRRVLVPLSLLVLGIGGAGLLSILAKESPTGAATGTTGGCDGEDGDIALLDEPVDATPKELEDQADEWSRYAMADLEDSLSPEILSQLEAQKTWVDDGSLAHTRYQQAINGVPVWGGNVVVHLYPDGRLRGIEDELLQNVELETTPQVLEADAVTSAVTDTVGDLDLLTAEPETDLWVIRLEDEDHLAWRVQLERLDESAETARPVRFVSAVSGKVLWGYDNLQTASGTSNYDGTVDFETLEYRGTYYLEDENRRLTSATFENTETNAAYLVDDDNNWTEDDQTEGVDVHWAMSSTYDALQNTLGYSLDDLVHPLAAIKNSTNHIAGLVNYGTAYNNAFWSSGYAVFGDGDGANFSPLTNLDVVAHELTHGVVEATAGLIYEGESGALNESYADAFAAVVEHSVEGDSDDVWLIGEDCWTPNTDGDALRYMADPTLDGSSRDHYDDRYQGSQDNGGVHLNSGIPNLAFYLTAQGGSHPSGGDPVQGIGIEKAGKIWIQALQASLTASSTLSDARDATLMAAIDLYGDEDESLDVLALAWHLVGLGDPPDSSNDSDLEQAASPCSGEDTVVTGSISGTGASVQVTDSPYYVDLAGTHQGCLAGNRQANLDLVLLQFIGGRWTRVASGNSGSSRESVSYEGSRGYYSWAVRSRQGSGSFVMGFTTP